MMPCLSLARRSKGRSNACSVRGLRVADGRGQPRRRWNRCSIHHSHRRVPLRDACMRVEGPSQPLRLDGFEICGGGGETSVWGSGTMVVVVAGAPWVLLCPSSCPLTGCGRPSMGRRIARGRRHDRATVWGAAVHVGVLLSTGRGVGVVVVTPVGVGPAWRASLGSARPHASPALQERRPSRPAPL